MEQLINLALLGLGPTEIILVLLIVLLLFGSRKLPELAKSMGSSIQAFKQGLKDTPPDPPQISTRAGDAKHNGGANHDEPKGH